MYEKNNDINRRVFFVGGGMVLLSSFLFSRLWSLQINQNDKFTLLSDKNRIRLVPVNPKRGNFYDRNGQPLAINTSNFKLTFNPDESLVNEELVQKISQHISLSSNELKRINKSLRKKSNNKINIKDNLTIEEIFLLNNLDSDFEYFQVENDSKRSYLDSKFFSHVLGYIGEVDSKNSSRTSISGVVGLEARYNDILSGHLGHIKTEVNSSEKDVRILEKNQAIDGQDIILTIDKDLQKDVFSIMGNNTGAATVMDVQNGELLALCSTPSFDNNKFIDGFSVQEWDELSNNEKKPFLNKAINGEYPPGSTFKIVTALAGLEEGLLNPSDIIFCEGKTAYGDRDFHCWKNKGHKEVDLRKAIKESCDVYFYNLATKLGVEKISKMAFRLGLGKNYNLISNNERKGLLPTREWIKDNLNNKWNLGDTLVAGIGQGYISATPIQLNVMVAMIANKGFYVEPSIIKFPKIKEKRRLTKPAGFNFDNVDLIRNLLDIAVNESGSNAYSSRIMKDDWRMAGKTGTSQVKEITAEERNQEVIISKNWEERDHALFVGYAPTKKPKYAVSVVIEHGGSGSQKAAPLGRDILLACRNIKASRYRV